MKIGINGFGRIGRSFYRAAHEARLDIVAVNDLADLKTLAHLLKYDSTYGHFPGEVEETEDGLMVNGRAIKFFQEKEPNKLPWKDLGVDLVIESTGVFTQKDGASKHLEAGAKYVLITAPCKNGDVGTFVLGVNEDKFDAEKDRVMSMASCTTNALTPIAKVLNDVFGIEKAMMSTIHSYTMDQVLQDSPHKDLRRARAASESIIPTTTGATKATAEVIPDLKDKMDGVSFRVPTSTVSLVDFVALLKKNTTVEEINAALIKASEDPKMQGAIAVSDEPLVSADYKGNPNASIVDLLSTQVVGGNLTKVVTWYDNEMGYSYRLAEFCRFLETKVKNNQENNDK
jgi:glyceraldehyde 3-phosphate dehydrogenase